MVAFYTEASEDIGFGHLMECISLAQFIRKHNKNCKNIFLFYLNTNRQAVGLLKKLRFPYKIVSNIYELKEELIRDHPKICICNLRKISIHIQEVMHDLKIRTVIIDELGNKEIMADILINGSPIKKWHNYIYPNFMPLTLLGPEYMIMKSEFKDYHEKSKKFDHGTVLTTMGCVDRTGSTIKIIEALKGLKAVKKKVVIGPGFVHKDKLNGIAAMLDGSYQMIWGSDNMAELMYRSDVVFTAGGNTIYELACVGTPGIVLWEDDHERVQAEWFAKAGVVLNSGRGVDVSAHAIRETTQRLLDDLNKRRSMSQKGKGIVDGKGVEKIWEAIGV